MEIDTEEYYQAIKNLMDVVVKEGEAGPYTDKGVREDGSDFLFRLVDALSPWGIRLVLSIEPIEEEESQNDPS